MAKNHGQLGITGKLIACWESSPPWRCCKLICSLPVRVTFEEILDGAWFLLQLINAMLRLV
jgi:hypothetical protein